MVKQRSIGGDGMEEPESSSQFLDALRTHAMDDLHTAALEYGIILKDLAVIDRQFKGETLSRQFCDQPLTRSQVRSPAQWTSSPNALCKPRWRLPYVFSARIPYDRT
jgi:hypothetical protein